MATTRHVANLLNEAAPMYQLPPEILTRILYLAVDHGSEEHAEQVIPLTHVCRYWRTLLLSYPRMWSTLCMKPGNPSVISEWLVRSENVPLTVIAEFIDTYHHPPCRYEDSATATLPDPSELDVCPRHEAVLSLNQLLPHRSRIYDLNILVHFSAPHWGYDNRDGEPTLLNHHFFRETLPDLERLNFRAAHFEGTSYMIPTPDHLFAGQLPRLRELKYLGVFGGLTETAKGLESCEIGHWFGTAGPAIISPERFQVLFSNNKTVKSLVISDCEFFAHDFRVTTAAPLTDLNFLRICCFMGCDLETVLNSIHIPQFRSLDTVQLSVNSPRIRVAATDSSGRTFQFSQIIGKIPAFYPLRHLGAEITTLRLDRGMTLEFDRRSWLYDLLQSFNAVQVLEFAGAAASVRNVLSNILSKAVFFPGLKIIRVAISRGDCRGSLPLLALALKLRMKGGNPLATVEPLFTEGEGGLGRVEWEKYYKAEGMQNLLSA